MAKKKNSRKPRTKQAPRDSVTDQPQLVNNSSLFKRSGSTTKAQQKAKDSSVKISTTHLPLPDGFNRLCYRKKVNKCRRKNSKRTENMDDSSIGPWANPPGQNKESRSDEVEFILSRLDDSQKFLDQCGRYSQYLMQEYTPTKDQYIEKYILKKYQPAQLVPRKQYYYNDQSISGLSESDAQNLDYFKYWPNIPRVLTVAPLSLSNKETSLRHEMVQDNMLFKFLRVPELGDLLMEKLSHQTVKNLILTCSQAHLLVSQLFDTWDLTRGDFHGCDFMHQEVWAASPVPRSDPAELKRGVGKSVVVSPFRLGWPKGLPEGLRRDHLFYYTQFTNTVCLFKSIFNYGRNIRTLHLHRVPFLSVEGLELILAGETDPVPNLTSLGIYRCELLHFGSAAKILQIAKVRRKEHGRKLDALDFFPRYHDGPMVEGRLGSFGLSWGDSGIDTPASVASELLWRILPAAAELGFDFTSEVSSFRQFLEKLPLPDLFVPHCLAIADQKIKAGLDTPTRDLPAQLLKDMIALVEHRVIDENNRFVGNWQECCVCNETYPINFIHCKSGDRCAGCVLSSCLDSEWDHYKLNKSYIAEVMLRRRLRDDPQKKKKKKGEEDGEEDGEESGDENGEENDDENDEQTGEESDDENDGNKPEPEGTRQLGSLDEFIQSMFWEATDRGDEPAGMGDAKELVKWLDQVRLRHAGRQPGMPPPPGFATEQCVNPFRVPGHHDTPRCEQQPNFYDPTRSIPRQILDPDPMLALLHAKRYQRPCNLDVMRQNYAKNLLKFTFKKKYKPAERTVEVASKHFQDFSREHRLLGLSIGSDRAATILKPELHVSPAIPNWGLDITNPWDSPPEPWPTEDPPVWNEDQAAGDSMSHPAQFVNDKASNAKNGPGNGKNGGKRGRKNWERNFKGNNQSGQGQQNGGGRSNDKSGGQRGNNVRKNQGNFANKAHQARNTETPPLANQQQFQRNKVRVSDDARNWLTEHKPSPVSW